ncbi:type II toxin-antitoxin system VapC family toxin [Patescibacteria group bacterium]|nr:type II toxin-antitoxin system VapC family toxin [Patescibacteria group bacterium]
MDNTFVLDASVAVKWFNQKDENLVENAKNIFINLLTGKINIIIPELLILEVLNALIRRKKIKVKESEKISAELFSYPWTIEPLSYSLMQETIKISTEYSLTIYDAVYITIAIEKDIKLISHDIKGHFSKFKKYSIPLENF